MDEISTENKLLIIKLKIKHEVAIEVRSIARIFMLVFALIVIFGSVGFTPPSTIESMIVVIVLCFAAVPVCTMIGIYVAIRYISEKRFKKYLDGEELIERE